MSGQAPPPPDWKGMQDNMMSQAGKNAGMVQDAASTQLANNRLNTSSPFASQTFGPNGTSTQLAGGLGTAAQGLMGQAGSLGQGLDWGQFGKPMTGDAARDQAINASYGQATSRLDPMWSRREDQLRTRLLNQGLAEDSEAYRNAMGDLQRDRNDAYSSAMNMAIGQGTQAGDSAFRNNMLSYQQQVADAIRQRQLPLQELGMLQGFLGQPGYHADNSTLAGASGAAGMKMQGLVGANSMAQQAYQQQLDEKAAADQAAADAAAGGMSAAGAVAGAVLPALLAAF